MNRFVMKKHRNEHRTGVGSILDFGIHRKYPTRLRDQGIYVGKAPTVEQQVILQQVGYLQNKVHALLRKVDHLMMPKVPIKRTGMCKKSNGECHRRESNKREATIVPYPDTLAHKFGNCGLTENKHMRYAR